MFKKYKKILFLFVLVFVLLTISAPVLALELNYPVLPGFPNINNARIPANGSIPAHDTGVADFLAYFFGVAMVSAGILGVFSIVIAGIRLLTIDAGNPSAMGEARERIFGSILGIILLMFSFIILRTINPALITPTNTGLALQNGVWIITERPIAYNHNPFTINIAQADSAPTSLSDYDISPFPISGKKSDIPRQSWAVCFDNASKKQFVFNGYKSPDGNVYSGGDTVIIKCITLSEFSNPDIQGITLDTYESFDGGYLDPGIYFFQKAGCDVTVDNLGSHVITSSGKVPEGFIGSQSALVVDDINDTASYGFLLHGDGNTNCSPVFRGANLSSSSSDLSESCIDLSSLSSCGTGKIKIIQNTIGGNGTFSYNSNYGVGDITTVNGTGSWTSGDLPVGGLYNIFAQTPPGPGWSYFGGPGVGLVGNPSFECKDEQGNLLGGATANAAVEGALVIDGQTVTCTFENTIMSSGGFCGDNTVQIGEQCEPPNTSTCDSSCQTIGNNNSSLATLTVNSGYFGLINYGPLVLFDPNNSSLFPILGMPDQYSPGDYRLSAPDIPGYIKSYVSNDNDCDFEGYITLNAGDDKNCWVFYQANNTNTCAGLPNGTVCGTGLACQVGSCIPATTGATTTITKYGGAPYVYPYSGGQPQWGLAQFVALGKPTTVIANTYATLEAPMPGFSVVFTGDCINAIYPSDSPFAPITTITLAVGDNLECFVNYVPENAPDATCNPNGQCVAGGGGIGCNNDTDCTPAPSPILGCTDPDANNPNPNATQDDGSCLYTIDFNIVVLGGNNNGNPGASSLLLYKSGGPFITSIYNLQELHLTSGDYQIINTNPDPNYTQSFGGQCFTNNPSSGGFTLIGTATNPWCTIVEKDNSVGAYQQPNTLLQHSLAWLYNVKSTLANIFSAPFALAVDSNGNPVCGDGIIETGEECDPADGAICGVDCQLLPNPNPNPNPGVNSCLASAPSEIFVFKIARPENIIGKGIAFYEYGGVDDNNLPISGRKYGYISSKQIGGGLILNGNNSDFPGVVSPDDLLDDTHSNYEEGEDTCATSTDICTGNVVFEQDAWLITYLRNRSGGGKTCAVFGNNMNLHNEIENQNDIIETSIWPI